MNARFALPLTFLLVTGAGAASADPSAFAFLEVPAGARAAALGGAYTSLASGAEAPFWNAAGLSTTRGFELAASHEEFFQTLRHDQFAIAGPAWGGAIGASIRAQYSGSIVERDDLGNQIGSFGSHDLEFALSYGHAVGGGLAVGGAAKYVRERIADLAAATWAFDGGVTLDPSRFPRLTLGLAAQNLGPAAAYTIDGIKGEPMNLPAAIQTGGSYAIVSGPTFAVRGALEGRFTRGRSGVGMVGAEIGAPAAGAALRIGMRVNDSASSFAMGAGYTTGGLRLDYAFVPYKQDLGDTHRFSLAARF
jgi:hypothetical protein